MFLYYDDDLKVLVIRAIYPLVVQDAQKLRVAELLARLNAILLLGGFHLDFEDGEIVYRTVHLALPDELQEAAFQHLLRITMNTVDEYFVPILSMNAGLSEPITAFLECNKE